MNKLKIGTLGTAFIFFSYCMNDITFFHMFENNRTKESATEKRDQSIKASYLPISKRVGLAGWSKLSGHPNQIITAMPISFGIADANLISN